MACGTPVVAFRRGSVPEVIEDGVTGFVVDNVEQAVRAVEKLSTLDRRRRRAMFDRQFTAERMANDYLAIYRRIIEKDIAPMVEIPAGSRAAAVRVATGSASFAD